MLEEMAWFFENRLLDYDEHMMNSIEGATEFYKFTAAQLPSAEYCAILNLGCGTGLELEKYFDNFRQIKLERGMIDSTMIPRLPSTMS